ncbi:MAG: spore maturation protein [Lachnospiraceae bacterium]|nr:spore maturation protein [Lachnospiraceae bacterium]
MNLLNFLSNTIVPLLLFYIVGFGLLMKQNIYDDFLTGAKDGMKTVAGILPTLIGLMIGVGILRASGFLDFFCGTCLSWTKHIGIPAELMSLAVVKIFSSSAATGLLLDLYKEHGCDSFLGMAASLMLSSTETIFYTVSIYFMSVKIKKTRFTLPGALLATLAGIAASIWLARMYAM